jgi:hypothetical protein
MIERIDPIPQIPKALHLAALQRKLVPFIGAGVSQLGGCPSWHDFANRALRFFVTHGKLSHAQLREQDLRAVHRFRRYWSPGAAAGVGQTAAGLSRDGVQNRQRDRNSNNYTSLTYNPACTRL